MIYMDETSVNLWESELGLATRACIFHTKLNAARTSRFIGESSGFMSEGVKEPHFRFIFSVVNKTNSVNTKAFLEKVIAEVPVPIAQIKLVCDNHSSHRSNSTTTWADSVGLSLFFMPAYSSPFNPVERVWAALKIAVSKFMAKISVNYNHDNFKGDIESICKDL